MDKDNQDSIFSFPFDSFFGEFDRFKDTARTMLDGFFGPTAFDLLPFKTERDYPKSNIFYDKASFCMLIQLAVPGFKMDELTLESEGTVLKVSGQSIVDNLDNSKKYKCRNLSTRNFIKKWSLPQRVNIKGISATLEDGILEIKIPTVVETSDVHKIKINSKVNRDEDPQGS